MTGASKHINQSLTVDDGCHGNVLPICPEEAPEQLGNGPRGTVVWSTYIEIMSTAHNAKGRQ